MPTRIPLALALPLLAGAAAAQTEVTLYGVVDAALVYSSNQNGHSETYMRSGNLAASRLGFRGTEELGGGTRALFQIEHGFETDTGQASAEGRIFNRQAFLGVANTRLGMLTLGRHYSAYYSVLGPLGPTTVVTGATGAHPGDLNSLGTTVRLNNSIAYVSPDWAGLELRLMAGLGESEPSVQGRALSAGLAYQRGNWRAGLAWQRFNNVANTPGWSPAASASFAISAVNIGYLSADAIHYTGAAVRYVLDGAEFGAVATHVRYRPGAASLFRDTAILNSFGLLATVRPAGWTLSAGYSYTRATEANGITSPARYHQIALEQAYSFSKATALYLLQSWQRAEGRTLNGAGVPVDAVAVVGDSQATTPSSNGHQWVLMAGLRKSF